MKLRYNKNIAIESICFNFKHYITICALNDTGIGFNQIFAFEIIWWIRNCSKPFKVSLYEQIPLIVDNLLIKLIWASIIDSWTYKIFQNGILDCFRTCAKLRIFLLLALRWLLWIWFTWITAWCFGKIIVI